MDYISGNKEAWEEAFNKRSEGWGKDIKQRLETEDYPFIEKVFADEINKYDYENKTIAQFCCNNGRELFSLMKFGASKGTGCDIAENMISFANRTAMELGSNCTFIAADILNIDEQFHDSFDYIFITVGALTWFQKLPAFFKKVSLCLKQGGRLMINEIHPVTNMLGMCGEENYDEEIPNKLVNSYFREEPWLENSGMYYICGTPYTSKTFCSYSHTFSNIFNAIIENGMIMGKLIEFDYDIAGSFPLMNNMGIPLSYILICQKQG
jgi:ubiquinone/menaquinone biosynthesis C-methylase UbiE